MLVGATMLAATADAELSLRFPPARYGASVFAQGPCGMAGGGRGENVTRLEPGAPIEVVLDEYVDRAGHFRIAFDVDGDDDFVDPPCVAGCDTTFPDIILYADDTVLLDGIEGAPGGGERRATVALPNVECDRCTLQVIHVLYDTPPYTTPGDDVHYQCADLALRRAVDPPPCAGDCNGNGRVSIDELLLGVRILLGGAAIDACRAVDADDSGTVRVEELVAAVANALRDCAASS